MSTIKSFYKMNKIYKKTKENIKNNHFLVFILTTIRAYGIYFLNKISNYKLEKIRFYKKLGYPLNLKDPKSFNEKVIWKKINDRNPLLAVTSDKYRVRSYLRKVLGEEKAKEVLIPLLHVTDRPETIPFEKLPPAFIVKPNHTSGRSIIVENSHFNKKEMIKTCRRWLKTPYGLEKLEWAYQPIKRKIIIEKLLREDDGKSPKQFNFYMFHGKCKSVHVIFGNKMNNPSISFFDEKWYLLSVKKPNRLQVAKIEKPKNYEIMLEIAEKLAEDFDHVRVDLYNSNEKIYFGELTHYAASGIIKLDPGSYEFELGKYWKIKPKYWEISEK